MSNSLIVDAVFAAIIIVAAVIGARRGFFRSVSGILGTVVGFIAAKAFTPPLSVYAAKPLTPWLFKLFSKTSTQSAFAKAAGGAAQGITSLRDGLLKAGLPSFISNTVANVLQNMSGGMEEFVAKYSDGAFVQKLAESAANIIAPIVTFIILYIVVRLLVLLLCRILSGNIPVIKTVNRAAGVILGIISGCVIVVALCWGVRTFAPETGGVLSIETVSGSLIGGFVLKTFW